AAEARGTKAPALAREADDHRVTATAARQVHEAVLEHAAAQILFEVAHDEARQPAMCLGALQKQRPVLANEPIEQRRLRLAPGVAIRPRRARLHGRAHGPRSLAAARTCGRPQHASRRKRAHVISHTYAARSAEVAADRQTVRRFPRSAALP